MGGDARQRSWSWEAERHLAHTEIPAMGRAVFKQALNPHPREEPWLQTRGPAPDVGSQGCAAIPAVTAALPQSKISVQIPLKELLQFLAP